MAWRAPELGPAEQQRPDAEAEPVQAEGGDVAAQERQHQQRRGDQHHQEPPTLADEPKDLCRDARGQ